MAFKVERDTHGFTFILELSGIFQTLCEAWWKVKVGLTKIKTNILNVDINYEE